MTILQRLEGKANFQFGNNLVIKVVAEGVGNQQAYNTLQPMGCKVQQVIFISKPVLPEPITSWVFQAKVTKTV